MKGDAHYALQVLTGPRALPTPQAAAYKSMPEAQMVSRRFSLAEARHTLNQQSDSYNTSQSWARWRVIIWWHISLQGWMLRGLGAL